MTLDQHADIICTTILMGQPVSDVLTGIDVPTGIALQDLVAERLSAPWGGVAGYKIAWNKPEVWKAKGLSGPAMARVFQKSVFRDRATVALSDYRGLAVEPEIIARIGSATEPGVVYSRESIAHHVAGFSVGIEVLDRLSGALSPGSAIAHNVFNAGAVIASREVAPDRFDHERITTRVVHGDTSLAEGGAMAPQDPLEAVADVATHFGARGYALEAGQIILCGSHIDVYAIDAAGKFGVAMSGLGEAWLSVA